MVAMQLSIIVPTLNEAAQIDATLRSLASLRGRGVEIIVVDGGSTDTTVDAARRLSSAVLQGTARGRAAQMNAGAAHASGDALLFLHADTLLPSDAGALVVQALQSHDWGRFDVTLDGKHPLLRVVEAMMNWRSRATGIATGDQAIFVRRSVFEAVGGFPNQPLMEDIDLCATLKRRGAPAMLRARVTTSARRWEKHGIVRTIVKMWCLRAAYFFGARAETIARWYR